MNELEVKSVCVKVGDLTEAIVFFRDVLGLKVEAIRFNEQSYALVEYSDTVQLYLSEKAEPNQTREIRLYTHDCLEQYCRLKAKGVHFKSQPVYADQGLQAEFSDPYGNTYKLLEPRNYND